MNILSLLMYNNNVFPTHIIVSLIHQRLRVCLWSIYFAEI